MSGSVPNAAPLARRPLLFVVLSGVLLSVGFAALIYGLTWLVRWTADPDRVREAQTALILYGRLVMIKALWPHWAATTVLYALLETYTPLAHARLLARIGALVAVGLVVAGFVVGFLLPAEIGAMPRVRVADTFHFVETCVEIALATTAAALVAAWALRQRPARDG